MTSKREQAHAVFLVALMVLSVTAGAIAFAGSATAAANNLRVTSSEPVKGTGTVTVTVTVTAGASASFAVEDAAGTVSDTVTVTDGSSADASTTSGKIKTTLDLETLFESTPASGTARVLALQGTKTVTLQNFVVKRQFGIDSSPPTVTIMGGSSNEPAPVYAQTGSTEQKAQVRYNIQDKPTTEIASATLLVKRNGNVKKKITGLQGGSGQNAQFTIPIDWAEGKYDLVLTATDLAGYTSKDVFKGGLVVDNTQPMIGQAMTGGAPPGGMDPRKGVTKNPRTMTKKVVVGFEDNGALAPGSIDSTDFSVGGDYTVGEVTVTKNNNAVLTLKRSTTTETSSEKPLLGRGEIPTVKLPDTAVIKDKAGNSLIGPQTVPMTDGLVPRAPDETTVTPTAVTAGEASSVEVSVKFLKTVEGTNGMKTVAAPPEGGTVHLKFYGPLGETYHRTMPADTASSTTTGTFDLTKSDLSDGQITVKAKMVDDSVHNWQNLQGYVARSMFTKDVHPPSVKSVTVENAPIDRKEAKSSQTVTVEFSEPMTTSDAPSVTVTGVSGGPYTVGGSFADSNTWKGTVDLPTGVETTATVEVSSATDSLGNSMESPFTGHTFEVDTKAPQNPTSTTITTDPVTTKNAGSVGVDVSFPSAPEAGTLFVRFTDGTTTVTKQTTLAGSSGTMTTSSTATTSATFDLSGSGLSGSVHATAKVTDELGNVNPDGFTAKSNTVTFDLTKDTAGATAPESVTVTNAPIDAQSVDAVSVDVTFPTIPEGGTVELIFSDGSTSVTKTLQASTSSKTTSGTVSLASSGLADGTIQLSARLVDSSGTASAAASTTFTLDTTTSTPDTTGPTFSAKTPADGTTAATPLSSISVAIADPAGVDPSTISVAVDDGDSDTNPDIHGSPGSNSQVRFSGGTLTVTPSSSLDHGTVTVTVEAADAKGNTARTSWSFRLTGIDSVTLQSVEHDFVGVVTEPDGTVTVEATAASGGKTVSTTSGGQFRLTLVRNGEQVTGTSAVTADASDGTITFDLNEAITGTPSAGPVTVKVATASGSAHDTGTVTLTHKVESFDSTWKLLGTPMPTAKIHSSGVANFYTYSPSTGYQSGADIKAVGAGYYAEKASGVSTARVGYTLETSGRSTLGKETFQTGWNLVGPTFDVDAKNRVTVESDLDPTKVSEPGVVVYTRKNGGFQRVDSPTATVGEFDGYFVYVESQHKRVLVTSTYQPSQDGKSAS